MRIPFLHWREDKFYLKTAFALRQSILRSERLDDVNTIIYKDDKKWVFNKLKETGGNCKMQRQIKHENRFNTTALYVKWFYEDYRLLKV